MKRLTFTKEEKENFKKRRKEANAKLSLAYQLGIYVGEKIINRFLPTLSVDSIQTRNNISVTCAEGDECRRLYAIWFNKIISIRGNDEDAKNKATETEWKAVRDYHEMLEEKYLPKKLECHLHELNITDNDMDEFKKGLEVSLWNCDCSHYSCDAKDIDVKFDDDGWFTIITLKKG